MKEKKEKPQSECIVKEKKLVVNSNSPDIQKQRKVTKQPVQAQPVPDNEKEESVVDVVTVPLQTHENVRSTSKEKKKKKGELCKFKKKGNL